MAEIAAVSSFFEKSELDRKGYTELDLDLSQDEFAGTIQCLSAERVSLISLFAQQEGGRDAFTLVYVFEKTGCSNLLVIKRRIGRAETGSVATVFASACWFEREIRDGFGIDFIDSYDKRRLFLHETYPKDFHPLLAEFKNGQTVLDDRCRSAEDYKFKEVSGEGVYQIPVGPVHAGIIEPGHFRFSVIGETIFNLEVRMFYKHRGIEKLAEGRAVEQGTAIAEAISGDESAVNSVAFAMCVEKVYGIQVPPRAWILRTILLEMERIYSHLGDLAGMIIDVAFPKGASPFFVLREELLRWNDTLTGSRFIKGMVCPGGLKRDIAPEKLGALNRYLLDFSSLFESALKRVRSVSSVTDRLEGTGVIGPDLATPLNITGPAARASGVAKDTRVDHPYGLYETFDVKARTADKGDVLARFSVKADEIRDSVSIIQRALKQIASGQIFNPGKLCDGHALSLVEAPRGQSMHWLSIKDGLIVRYKVRTASFCNWQAMEHAVLGNIVPDFPLINKSLNLSYAGTDL